MEAHMSATTEGRRDDPAAAPPPRPRPGVEARRGPIGAGPAREPLKIALLTVEDEGGLDIHRRIRSDLGEWLFIRRRLIRLDEPERDDRRCVTNLEDWRRVVGPLADENDLVFCTVDLRIPADASGGLPRVEHGLRVLREIGARHHEGVRGCVLTGLAGTELEEMVAREAELPEVLFDFKGDLGHGYRNVVNYIKSQALVLLRSVCFIDSGGTTRTVLIEERSGRLRDLFLSRAAYYVDASTWHVPTLLIGGRGLGRRTLVEFVAYLAEAELTIIDLGADSPDENRESFRVLQELRRRLEGSAGRDDRRRRLYYVANLDKYVPGVSSGEGDNCLWPLQAILKSLRALGPRQDPGPAVSLFLSVSGENRLMIRSRETREFIRSVEECLSETTGFPLHHLGMDGNGWPGGHPRVVSLPTLRERGGPDFLVPVIDSQLGSLQAAMERDGLGPIGGRLALADDVLDFLSDKTDWSRHGNLGGLVDALTKAAAGFRTQRSGSQTRITRGHLDAKLLARLSRVVLNADEVRHEFPTPGGGREVAIERADFHVDEGELLVLLGPSGCGKSTILRLLAGLMTPTAGRITYLSKPVTGPSAEVGFIFQDFSLFPWLTVRQNAEFGPRARGARRRDYRSYVDRLLEVANLNGHEEKYPHQLSGGMRQRLAIVRSLANRPRVLLMDEPFASLDVQSRWQMQNFLIDSVKQVRDPEAGGGVRRNTIVFVTHDMDEAVYVGDRIYIGSPRPLRLGSEAEVRVPFSAESRRDSLRADPVFTALVNDVRRALLAKSSAASGAVASNPDRRGP
jgi:ABC-type nitrate/sulfonate/bicarbonate transport system ATPase subunit